MSISGKKIVVTGKFDRGRKDIEAELEELGAEVIGSISGKTELLICGEDAGSKLAKAQKLGLPIVDAAGLEQLLAGADLEDVLAGKAKPAAKKKAAEDKPAAKKVAKKATKAAAEDKPAAKKKVAKKKAVKKAEAKPAAAKPTGGGSLAGMTVLVTGTFAKSRKDVSADLESLGAIVASGWSSKVQLLVAGEKAGSKLRKAEQAGISITDEYGFGCLMKGESLEQVLRYDAIFE